MSSVAGSRPKKGAYGLRLGGPEVLTKDLFILNGRTIIITGGAGAVGISVAGSILESGGDVICFDRAVVFPAEDWARLQSIAKEHGTQVAYHIGNVTDSQTVNKIFDVAVSAMRFPLRGLVACAGISHGSSALDYDINDFRRVVEINLNGTFICAQAAARIIAKQQVPGSVVLIASMSGSVSNKGVDTAAYNSSKSAVLQLGRSLAAEWGCREGFPQIRVNTLSPGYIKTALTAKDMLIPGREAEWSADNMLNRMSYADEYRGPVIFLLGDASSFMTGADLKVDGGHTAW
ncbi:D-arabinitol 2-dehydrogenase [Coleophoma crateriformis]|uniref:D-arabinitol 2-dehydrogenase n=1 Tax=Coleophoma crateriformis TaxID=565419 RepID=A0A3D8QI08_9HELO|nr:D-arabinitol 2-dehydrogenase [Coleophoma crateriformis]